MKKTLLVCMLLIAIVLSFAACGGKDDPPSNDGGNNNETPVHTHNFGEWETTVKPTCAEDGTKVRYCSCGEKQSEVVVALGHTPSKAVVEDKVEPTYEADGSYNEVVRCSTCNEKLSETSHTIPMLRHTPAEAVTENVVDATCYSKGSYDTVVYCSDCGAELERTRHTVDKIAHTPASAVEENLVDSTCYSTGSKDMVVYCSVPECHAFIEKSSVTIDKKAHTPASAVEENRVNPTYEKDGSYQMVVYCSVSACHEELERTTHTLDMLVHHPSSVVIENEVAATCTKNGSYDEVIYCLDSNCGHKELSRKTITTDIISHTDGTAVEENRVNATCYSEGSYDSVVCCAVCGTELSRATVTLQKVAHTPGSAVVENRVEATCTTDGSYDEVIYCSVENCKVQIARNTKIADALGHTEVIDPAVDATCTEAGLTEGKHCSTCGVVLVAQEVIEAKHNYINNVCSSCGYNTREFAGGTGTDSFPYLVSTATHLSNVRLYPSAYYELINDIQFTSNDFYGAFYNSGSYWDPIDDFTGNFDGNNYSIDGLKMNHNINSTSGNSEYLGLFSSTDGDISNLTLSNVSITVKVNKSTYSSRTAYVGGLAGRSNGKIANCTISGKITVTGNTDLVSAVVGGIVGYTYTNCSIENCLNYATVQATCTQSTYSYSSYTYSSYSYATVGGIVGLYQGTAITNCTNHGSVSANSIRTPFAGGIAGKCSGGTVSNDNIDIQVSACYNYGSIESISNPPAKIDSSYSSYGNLIARAGGIAANISETSVINCGNYASVTAKGWDVYAGGVIASVNINGGNLIEQCFNKGSILAYDTDTSSANIYGNHHAGGITADGGLIDQCYNTGSVTVTGKDYLKAAGISACTFNKISNCYNTGTISVSENATDVSVGGIIADCPAAVEYCYNTGTLIGTQKGGIVCCLYDGGSASKERHVLYCYYIDNVTVGVYETLDSCTKLTYSKTDSQLRQQSTFVNFDFNNIWTISDGEYPYPQLKNNTQTTD